MARPRAKDLTERELEIMQVYWDHGSLTAHQVRDKLETSGRKLAYTTVATLVKILVDKGFLEQETHQRPFLFRPLRSFKEVSGNIVSNLISSVFGGSRKELLVQLMERKKLTKAEKEYLKSVLEESDD